MADVVVTDHPGQSRYEARVGDTLAGFAQYQLTSELIVFTHTEVDDAFEGQGVGSALVQQALDHVRAERQPHQVLPLCPFVKRVDQPSPRLRRPRSTGRRPSTRAGLTGDGRPRPSRNSRWRHPLVAPTRGIPRRAGCRRGPRTRGGPTSLGAKTI